jgi:hypothetical protein
MHIGCLVTLYLPSPLAVSASQALAARRTATPPLARTSREIWSASCPQPWSRDRIGAKVRAAHVGLGALSGSRRSRRCGSQKWEPTCSAALGRRVTRSDSSRRSAALNSTQSDDARRFIIPCHGRCHWFKSSTAHQIKYRNRTSRTGLGGHSGGQVIQDEPRSHCFERSLSPNQ